jgi:glycosyltransferase involved in cell wall biosynthesis
MGQAAAGSTKISGANTTGLPALKCASNKVLRVMVATPLGPQGQGGIDRLTDAIIETMDKRGDPSVQVIRLVTRGNRSIYLSPIVFARALVEFWSAATRGEVDLLHIQLSWRGSTYRKLVLAAAARYLAIPYIVHLHSGQFDGFWAGRGWFLRQKIDRLFVNSVAVIVLGNYWGRLVAARLPNVKDKLEILPNATALPSRLCRAYPQGGKIVITFLGRLGPEKGIPQLIEALGKLAHRTDWSATIAGDGEVTFSRSHVRRLGIADRVDIPGWLDPPATAALLRRTGIFVLPSFIENLPMAVIEAFAYGLAIIATPVGAVPEVIGHDRNGLLVPAGDIDALASALTRLLDDEGLRLRLGETARRDHAERYEINAYAMRLLSIWQRGARA